ncbi:MAG: transglutaminase family protein [Magnetococcales bacterium]|nr:transglutaminase family protein [Magnetococcales bacterium]MBF0157094.1 transglutaminase family protein [Magnetococcales bacterium]
MTIRVAVRHHTHYRYDRLVALSPHLFRLRPAPHCRTPIEAFSLRIEPREQFLNWHQDPFGNFIARVVFPERCRELVVEVEIIARMITINPFDFFLEESARHFPFAYAPSLGQELAPYLVIEEAGPRLESWMADIDRGGEPGTIDFLVAVNRRVWQEIGYTIRLEAGVQTAEETLTRRTGSCRDSAWLLVQVMRRLGLAARFVSGYLVQLTADEKSLDGPSGPEKDFTDLHAWCEVFVPGAGWLGLDPTSGLFAGEGHIPLACAPHYESAAAVTGMTDPCETLFSFRNAVTRIAEAPRTTKPYSEEHWQAIDRLGESVDGELEEQGVRLSMGGEPTFVSIDDMDGAEWTVAADGPHKRRLATDLLRRLQRRFAPGGLLHFGQGKWYPGEELPRWRYGCFWRADGRPLRSRPWPEAGAEARIGGDDGLGSGATAAAGTERPAGGGALPHGDGVDLARRFLVALGRRLGGVDRFIRPAYEDPFYHLWKEATLPVDVDPLEADLDDPLERRRLARLLERGLGRPTGFVLPLDRESESGTWISGAWRLRQGHLFLQPGDSPMGLRLPLGSLEFTPEAVFRQEPERCPFAPVEALDGEGEGRAGPGRWREGFVRTALTIEPREGGLYLFLPPFTRLENFLALIEVVEATVEAEGIDPILEGYPPPEDARLRRFFITPDPGVIEVNIHPSLSWASLKEKSFGLYEEARLARLGTEKFLVDGRHTGTGGGNHITIGGATPAESPLLRRPELLASLLTYWQHHPGLSYLFSGLFIGPTSQAPRVDEARDDSLHELEIALSQIPEGEVEAPWLADRLLRHILVDLTGNTHRAEFCIDKLYSPDSPTGRLGLVELRAFEMPPHPRMSLVQALLLRTLIAWFWKSPWRRPLIRWGTALHDQFLLPFFVEADLRQVVEELRRAGYPFEMAWLEPFFTFRFPVHGSVRCGPVTLELRQALEPWHVLGEETTRQGTARFVDSSVERLQVRVEGLIPERYGVACNGHRLPLRSTGVAGEFVAGVRFKAWQPPSGLHPLIPVHSPLTFDVIDQWNECAVGGCSYHVVHPGGRSYESFPVNGLEAESRRISRFWDHGHLMGERRPQAATPVGGRFIPEGSGQPLLRDDPLTVTREYTTTLDLRRVAGAG